MKAPDTDPHELACCSLRPPSTSPTIGLHRPQQMTYTGWISEEHPTRLELTVSASPRRRSGGRRRRRPWLGLCRAINHNQGLDSLRHGKARQATSSEFNSQRLRTRLVIKRAPFMSLGRLRCLTDAFIVGVIINIPQPPSSSFAGQEIIFWIEFNRGLFSIQFTISQDAQGQRKTICGEWCFQKRNLHFIYLCHNMWISIPAIAS